MKRLDEINSELKRGYQLTISKEKNHEKCYGLLSFRPHPFLISDCAEVEVDVLMKNLPNISEELDEYKRIMRIYYDISSGYVMGSIEQKVTEGPYCEESHYEVVEDFQVGTSSSVLALHELDSKIASSKRQNKMKLLRMERQNNG